MVGVETGRACGWGVAFLGQRAWGVAFPGQRACVSRAAGCCEREPGGPQGLPCVSKLLAVSGVPCHGG